MLSRLFFYLRRARGLPLRVVAQKAARVLSQEAGSVLARQIHRVRPTYGAPATTPPGALARYLALPPLDLLVRRAAQTRALSDHALAHRFDLLGSGWVQVRHGMACAGVEGHRYDSGPAVQPDPHGRWLESRINRANRPRARQVWALVSPGYVPIDWHLDFKSGHRWREDRWHLDIAYGDRPGVDVKVPWELARMQHLPQLAWAFALAQAGTPAFQPAERYAAEFRNQVLDFIATNPPCFGVNWRCTMDVAIRVANWLVAYDLICAAGAAFDAPFEAVLRQSVQDHGRYIVRHLEWTAELRGNHYLADIAGLLFVAAYLPRSRETDAWLAFSVQELVAETLLQFHEDGANFEASTSYHRLSAEMALYATALVQGLPGEHLAALRDYEARAYTPRRPALRPAPQPLHPLTDGRTTPFPPEFLSRLEQTGVFALAVTRPDGTIHQVGDNDSGRFLKLDPAYLPLRTVDAHTRCANLPPAPAGAEDAPYWLEQHLDQRGLAAALAPLFPREDFAAAMPDSLEAAVVHTLVRTPLRQASSPGGPAAPATHHGSNDAWTRAANLAVADEQTLRIPVAPSVLKALQSVAYPDFGLYLLRSPGTYLAFRCGPIGQRGNGGHAHNDQLAMELVLQGRPLIVDPGSYLYTPLPQLRNAYRSVNAHFAPRVRGREPGALNQGAFRLGDEARAECLYFGPRGFIGRHIGYGTPVWRIVTLAEGAILVRDVVEGTPGATGPRLEPLTLPDPLVPPYSPGYGIVERRGTVG